MRVKLLEGGILPTKAHPLDAGYDLYASKDIDAPNSIGAISVIPTGVAVEVPPGYVGLVMDRSSMAKRGYKVLGGVIDAGYVGEVSVLLLNTQICEPIKKGDRVAQLVLSPVLTTPVEEVEELRSSTRGNKGFGSSGK